MPENFTLGKDFDAYAAPGTLALCGAGI